MFDQSKLIQSQYELAMAIGTSLDLTQMLRASMTPLLKLMNSAKRN
jgi:hypothetical protein